VTDHLLEWALPLALCPAPTVLVLFLVWRRRQSVLAKGRAPLQPMRRRPPGESFRVRLTDTDESIFEWLIYLAVSPAIVGLTAALAHARGFVLPSILWVASAMWAAVCAGQLRRLNRRRTNLELDFDGRRRVAEELNRLIAEGFEVYHDVPHESFHLDHVLVGPAGLFAVETKVRPRPPQPAGATAERAEFDGFRVTWPALGEACGLESAVGNARVLGQWLSEALKQTVDATPVLLVPGWAVESKSTSQTVLVLNERQVGTLCESKNLPLSEELIRRICHHLNHRCAGS
jgi:hypothetical protein